MQKVLFAKNIYTDTHWELLESLFCNLCLCLCGSSLAWWLNLLFKSVSLYQFLRNFFTKKNVHLYLLLGWIANFPGHFKWCSGINPQSKNMLECQLGLLDYYFATNSVFYFYPVWVCELYLPTKKRFCQEPCSSTSTSCVSNGDI